MRVLRVGARSLLVEVEDTETATRLYREARRRETDAVDVVPGARTVLFDDVADLAALEAEVGSWDLLAADVATADPGAPGATSSGATTAGGPAGGPAVEVPTVYDGPDLEAVARLWGMTTGEVVRTHTTTPMVVAFCGFAPGFAYCAGIEPTRRVPRLETPRTRVPAGAVGLADTFTGIYPTASPGGWQLIGRTDLVLWDDSRDQPATLPPGTPVRFVEVDR